jgi:hypothetical protein
MENKIRAYSLEEISKWQNEENSCIQLPSMQRGFVWRPHQIENLWDSILRGYPIGAILMCVDEEDKTRFLLDGQQRCTSIALGYFDPFKDTNSAKYFSLKTYLPSIWIDLKPKIKNENKFLVRVLTKSHPWGYQAQREKNGTGKTLSMTNRKDAFKYFTAKEDTTYINLKSSTINPWDANFPVPLSWLLSTDTSSLECFITELRKKFENLKLKNQHSEGNEVDFKSIKDEDFKIYREAILTAKKLLIPEIKVESNLLKDDDEELSEESQNPTLFVRLNSAGTTISGEELIYSIYKAAFPEIKELVEKIGASFIAPGKVINMIARLVYCEINGFQSFPSNFNVNSFRKVVKNPVFRDKLNGYILNNNGKEATQLIDIAKIILSQNNSQSSILRIPQILIKQFIVSSPDLFLVLLINIKQNNFHNVPLDKSQIKDISASFVHLLWFGYDNNKTPSLLFNQLKIKNSWSDSVKVIIKNNQAAQLVKPELLRDNLINIVSVNKISYGNYEEIKKNNLLCDEIKKDLLGDKLEIEVYQEKALDELLKSRWLWHIDKIFKNRVLLIYAQRQYFNEKFQEFNQLENIEDTNRPWDWDHIYPKSWVDSLHNIHYLVKHWVNSNGNFRALSYDDNRSESNNLSPADRLDSENKRSDSFISESDFEEFWGKLGYESKAIKRDDEKSIKIFLNAVVNRTVNIYEEWYNNYYS